MKAEEIREGDIVEIDYISEFTKEHINEGKALVIWKGFNHQPLVRKMNTRSTIWTCYENIARVVGHIDIEAYMDKALTIPENPTNGDIIKAMFPNVEWVGAWADPQGDKKSYRLEPAKRNLSARLEALDSWWNAPYNAESEVNTDEEN